MKLLVIGHSVLDFIGSGEEKNSSAGGIYYSVSVLNRLKQDKDEIFLASQFDDETYFYFKPEFDKVKNRLLKKVDKIPRVHLNLFEYKERHESYENITGNLTVEIVNNDNYDAILINMITGFDITLEQLKNIRKKSTALIYIDIHTLSRGLGANFKREFRIIPEFIKWAECVDIIQVNDAELFTLSDKISEYEIACEMFNAGVKNLCVTKGELGAKVYFKKSDEIVSYFVSAKKVSDPNIIGCGDAFGAAYFYSYINNKNETLGCYARH